MYVTFSEALAKNEMRMMKCIAGSRGLTHIIKGWQMVEYNSFRELPVGRSLVFSAGVDFADDPEMDHKLFEMTEYIYTEGAAGLVLELGKFLLDIPEKVKNFCEENNFPLLEIPYKVRISDITYRLTQLLVERTETMRTEAGICREICMGNYSPSLQEKVAVSNYRGEILHFPIVLEQDPPKTKEAEELILDIADGLSQEAIQPTLWFEKNKRVTILVPVSLEEKDTVKSTAERLLKSISVYGSFSAGVGPLYENLEDAADAFMEAEEALDMIRQCMKNGEVRVFENTGVYRLFYEFGNKKELKDIYNSILQPLLSYDESNGTNMVELLRNFLDSSCNIKETAEKLNIPRNTVRYRINKIEEVLNVDFQNVNQCFNLRLAYKICKWLNRGKRIKDED